MRILAAAAMLLAAAASLFAGDDDDEGGVELLYEFRDGEAPAAAKAIEKRLEQLEGTIVRPLEDGKRVLVQIQKQYQRELTRAAAERLGHLELRRAVDTDTKEFLTRRVAFHAALDRGEEIDKIREIPAESLTAEERKRSPGGLRWYKNPSPKDPPNDDWILCEIDAHGITEQALEDVSLAPAEYSDDRFDVRFHVKAEFQDKMAELTSVEDMRLPIILDGEIVAAPVVHSQIRDRGSITIGLTEACVILVAFKDGVLPSKPKLVAERRITNPEEKEGAELLYEFRDGEAPAAAKVLQRRLDLLGVTASVTPVEDGKRVGVRVRGRDRLEDVRDAAARVGHLELRRAADRSANEYMARWMALQTAIRRGEDVEKIREIPADSLSAEERKRSPGGLRWYKDPGSTRPSQDWVLCEIDADGITEEAIGEIRVVPSVFRFYEIRVSVKKGFQEKMADLTSRPYTVLAVIVDGEFVGAPLVRGQLREEGTIRITGEREARRIAAALGGGVLPSEPKLLAERWVGVAGKDAEEGGTELLYEFGDGEAPAAAKVLEKRLKLLEVGGTVKPLEDGKRVLVRLDGRDRLEDVRTVAGWVGHMELRRYVRVGAWSGYRECLRAFAAAREQGADIEKAREVSADSLAEADRQRWLKGLRWYRDVDSTDDDSWSLCERDDLDITQAALEDVGVVSSVEESYDAVEFRVKADFREKMAKLLAVDLPPVAIIVDDQIVFRVFIDMQSSERGWMAVKKGIRARRIAAALGGGVLPSEPKLLAERWVGR